MICIPQTCTIQGTDINRDFVETHILKPSPYFKGQLITSHSTNSKILSLSEDGCSIATADGFQSRIEVKIICEELAYNKDYEQYRILIVDQPLDPKFQKLPAEYVESMQITPQQCVALADCMKFLQSSPDFSKALEKLDQGIKLFNSTYMVLPDYLQDAASRLAELSSETVEMFVRCAKQKSTNVLWKDTLISVMESYVMNAVHSKVIGVVTKRYSDDDRHIERKCREQLRDILPEALGIQHHFVCPLPNAIMNMNRLDELTTPREKLYCLKSVIDAVTLGIQTHFLHDIPHHLASTAEKPCLTSDDLIPILVTVIGQSTCEHLQSDIVYTETFSWASSTKDMDDLSYCLVTFKAAIQYILTTDFSHLPQKLVNKKQTSADLLSSPFDQLSITNGSGRGDKSCPGNSPTLAYQSVSALPTSDRLERKRLRIAKVLKDLSPPDHGKEKKEQFLSSIFGAQYASATLESASGTQAPQDLGDFLSSLQDEFDQPFGKLN